jgi:phosphoenolpyruvate carboxykinase (ATP)
MNQLELPKTRLIQQPIAHLVELALEHGEGLLSSTGALVVKTGRYTGRSPNDRFIVDTPSIHDAIDWGTVNRPITESAFERIYDKVLAYLNPRPVYESYGLSGADPKHSLRVRFITEYASHNLFVRQLFVKPSPEQLATFQPDWTLLSAPGLKLNPQEDGVNSEAAVIIHFERKLVLIAATAYAGEMKKSLFSIMNFLMPAQDVFPMHCSANEGDDGSSALFFGLSGTGKTTLSADPNRKLIGDDEHGWSPDGVFNFEGGCYAKAIRLSAKNEPEIYQAIRFGALVENAVMDEDNRKINYDDDSLTENSRVGYPIDYIPNASLTGQTSHPTAILFLTADAYGVLPPVAKLTVEQAQYHFLSGYTSKLAGTERGITEPQATFSTCFGAPFMPRPAAVYADMLKQRLQEHAADVYLINTGWQGGAYGVGQRVPIPVTRAMVTAALNGSLKHVNFELHPIFNVLVPQTCPGVDPAVLNPRDNWADKAAYDEQAKALAQRFVDNFKQFANVEHLVAAGPQV